MKRTAQHNFVSVHDVCLQYLNSCCLKPSAVLPLSSQRGGCGTSGRTMKTLFFLSSAKLTWTERWIKLFSHIPRDAYCKIYVRSEKNNFHGISTLLCTSQGQHYLTPDDLALSGFSRTCKFVKTKVVKSLCEIYQLERANNKVVGNLLKDRSEQEAGKLLKWISCWRNRKWLCWWQVPIKDLPFHIHSLGYQLCQMSDEHFNVIVP